MDAAIQPIAVLFSHSAILSPHIIALRGSLIFIPLSKVIFLQGVPPFSTFSVPSEFEANIQKNRRLDIWCGLRSILLT